MRGAAWWTTGRLGLGGKTVSDDRASGELDLSRVPASTLAAAVIFGSSRAPGPPSRLGPRSAPGCQRHPPSTMSLGALWPIAERHTPPASATTAGGARSSATISRASRCSRCDVAEAHRRRAARLSERAADFVRLPPRLIERRMSSAISRAFSATQPRRHRLAPCRSS